MEGLPSPANTYFSLEEALRPADFLPLAGHFVDVADGRWPVRHLGYFFQSGLLPLFTRVNGLLQERERATRTSASGAIPAIGANAALLGFTKGPYTPKVGSRPRRVPKPKGSFHPIQHPLFLSPQTG